MPICLSNILSATCIALTFSACVSTSISSNKSDNLKGPFKKILIVLHSEAILNPFCSPLMENLKKEFSIRNIDLKTLELIEEEKESLSLKPPTDNENINAQINSYLPEAVLFMRVTKIEMYTGVISGKGSNGATFDLRLFQAGDLKAPIWRASYHVYGNSGISMAVKKGTNTLLAKLEEDKIIIH